MLLPNKMLVVTLTAQSVANGCFGFTNSGNNGASKINAALPPSSALSGGCATSLFGMPPEKNDNRLCDITPGFNTASYSARKAYFKACASRIEEVEKQCLAASDEEKNSAREIAHACYLEVSGADFREALDQHFTESRMPISEEGVDLRDDLNFFLMKQQYPLLATPSSSAELDRKLIDTKNILERVAQLDKKNILNGLQSFVKLMHLMLKEIDTFT